MNQLQNFNFNNLQVRTVLIESEPWFVAKDVADILEYSDTQAMTRRLDKEDIMTDKLSGMNMKSTIINESGLYESIIGSKKKETRPFKRWITHEVLPTIRKHGAYMTDSKLEEALLNPDVLINLATSLKEERGKRLIAEQRINELQPKADYYDKILNNKGLSTVSVLAKNYGMSATKFNNMLHKFKIQYKQGETWLLYAPYQAKGYTHSEPFDFTDGDGNKKVSYTMKWTQKGHMFLYEFLKKKNILPIIEQDDLAS